MENNQECSAEYKEGYRAYFFGKKDTDNPYNFRVECQEAQDWHDGFFDASDENNFSEDTEEQNSKEDEGC